MQQLLLTQKGFWPRFRPCLFWLATRSRGGRTTSLAEGRAREMTISVAGHCGGWGTTRSLRPVGAANRLSHRIWSANARRRCA